MNGPVQNQRAWLWHGVASLALAVAASWLVVILLLSSLRYLARLTGL